MRGRGGRQRVDRRRRQKLQNPCPRPEQACGRYQDRGRRGAPKVQARRVSAVLRSRVAQGGGPTSRRHCAVRKSPRVHPCRAKAGAQQGGGRHGVEGEDAAGGLMGSRARAVRGLFRPWAQAARAPCLRCGRHSFRCVPRHAGREQARPQSDGAVRRGPFAFRLLPAAHRSTDCPVQGPPQGRPSASVAASGGCRGGPCPGSPKNAPWAGSAADCTTDCGGVRVAPQRARRRQGRGAAAPQG